VLFEPDSFSAVRNPLKGGGPKIDLCQEIKEWWSWCDKWKVSASYAWIPREQNTTADQLSKESDRKWTVKGGLRDVLCKRWGEGCPGTLFCNPEFNAIGHTIRMAQKQQQRIILVFPGLASAELVADHSVKGE